MSGRSLMAFFELASVIAAAWALTVASWLGLPRWSQIGVLLGLIGWIMYSGHWRRQAQEWELLFRQTYGLRERAGAVLSADDHPVQ